jgi:hypothetical protein
MTPQPTKIAKWRIDEISAVESPAHDAPGWLRASGGPEFIRISKSAEVAALDGRVVRWSPEIGELVGAEILKGTSLAETAEAMSLLKFDPDAIRVLTGIATTKSTPPQE